MDPTTLFSGKLSKYYHLKKIRDNLWLEDGKSRVSVMVGAGFSLNANKLDDSLDGMSTWLETKEKILQELNNPEELKDKSVLYISEKYVKEYGRDSLDSLLRQAIPDQNYEPGEIHKELLRLPWTDVYTTNYDTLLERTLPNIIERNYQPIYDVRDIPNSVAPRIVKLHGSFPSNRPFVFTRKDYELYDTTFAPLVNMVQQSIMETTFVLLGFSGDDPNFETWTSWVYENLGEHMPKIYMLAYNESKSEEILNKKGITLIDFKDVYSEMDTDDGYVQMFNDIFQYLSYKEKKDVKDWPYKRYMVGSSKKPDELLNRFIYNRKNYPGWLIMPDIVKKRNSKTLQLACNELEKLASHREIGIAKRITAVDEVIWAYDTFQMPIDYHFHNIMINLVNEAITKDSSLKVEKILIRLLKESRLDYNLETFNKYLAIIEKMNIDKETENQFIFEKIMMKIARFEYNEVNSLMDKWALSDNDIEWKVKKAVILLKIGKTEEGIQILKDILSIVRKIIVVKNNNYRILSLEGIILSLLIDLESNSFQNSKERLTTLEIILCNPLKEIDFMISRIKSFEDKTDVIEKKGFDPNFKTWTRSFSNTWELELIDSYGLLMLYDEFGLGAPRKKDEKNAIHVSLKNTENFYPFYSWIIYLRIGDIKKVDEYFSRDVIYKVDQNNLSLFVEILVEGIDSKQNTVLMLEILSRVYFALKSEEKTKVDKLILELYQDNEFQKEYYNSSQKIFQNLFKRILFDKDNNKGEFVSEIYNLPIIGDTDGKLFDVVVDDFYFYDPSFEFKPNEVISFEIDISEIRKLQNTIKDDNNNIREAAFRRFTNLLQNEQVPNDIKEEMMVDIADVVRRKGTGLYNHLLDSYLILLTNDVDLQKKYSQERIQQPIYKSFNKEKGITTIGNGLNTLLNDLRNIFPKFKNKESRFLSLSDKDYSTWLGNFYAWWENQEDYLLREKEDFFEGNDDLTIMVNFLKNSFLNNISIDLLNSSDKIKLKNIYSKLDEQKPRIALLLIPVLLRCKIIKESNLDKIKEGMLSNNKEITKSSLAAMYDLSVLKSLGEIENELLEMKTTLLNIFFYQKDIISLIEMMKAISNIVEDAPDFFNGNDYINLTNSLKRIFNDFQLNYFVELTSVQEIELMPQLSWLAGQVYIQGTPFHKTELEDLKSFVKEHRLPEVRKYTHLFE